MSKEIYQGAIKKTIDELCIPNGISIEALKPSYYVEYLNKAKNFMKDRKYFGSIKNATIWGEKNIENFHPDMIKINF